MFDVSSPIFDSLTFSSADAGHVFSITQAQDPDFNSLVAVLVNGQTDVIQLELSFDNFQSIAYGFSLEENIFFAPLPAGNNGVDLQGFPIDNIALRLDSVNIGASSFSIQTTILVDSAAVPEPSMGALAGMSGLLWLLARRKTR